MLCSRPAIHLLKSILVRLPSTKISLVTTLLPGGRIIGGEEARAGQFPFAAALYVRTADATTFCSGALISNLWILTAGHCIDG
jgi:secreted trypsin-like serine protease